MAVHPVSVLVADDDSLLCNLLKYKLGKCGYSVLTASDGEQALEFIADRPPSLMVLDSIMPILDGISVLRQVRQTYTPVELPVVMLTAKRADADVISALRLGVSDYITKPFLLKEFILRIESLVKQSGHDRAARPDLPLIASETF